jgi:uncharacterized protein YkwD
MRRWGIVGLISVSAFAMPIVTAAPAHAVCIPIFRQCPSSPTTPPTTPPPAPTPTPTPPTTQPPAPPTPAPPPPDPAIDPNQAATQFFDLTNGERANAGVPALQWRADVASMAVAHSVEMAQQGNIWHGSFVSQGNLKALNASSLGENVGMGGDVPSLHDAFMNSPHHRENILDPAFNQVGIGVIVSGGTVFVTEDFLHSKSAGTARPTPVAHPTVSKPAAPRSSTKVASAPPRRVAAASTPAPAAPAAAAPVPAPQPVGVVTPIALEPTPLAAAANPAGVLSTALDGGTAVWTAMFGALLLVGALGGHVVVRRRRPA